MPDAVLYLVTNPIDHRTLDRIDRDATLIVLAPEAARAFSDRTVERLIDRRSMAIVVGSGTVAGAALAAGLNSDYFALAGGTALDFRAVDHAFGGAIMAGLVWRIGRRAIPLLLTNEDVVDAPAALRSGVVDALVPDREDPLEWVRSWLAGRSLLALQSAAALIRRSGGDRTERAEFARLFATGEPQQGLKDFLAKRRSDFSEAVRVETI